MDSTTSTAAAGTAAHSALAAHIEGAVLVPRARISGPLPGGPGMGVPEAWSIRPCDDFLGVPAQGAHLAAAMARVEAGTWDPEGIPRRAGGGRPGRWATADEVRALYKAGEAGRWAGYGVV